MLRFFSKRRLVTLVMCAVAILLSVPGLAHAAGVVDADAGEHFSLAVLSDGSLWGWGYNAQGQLGDGTLETHLAPSRVDTDAAWLDVSAGYRHTIAIRSDGTLWSWGWNKDGQLGIGHAENTYVPDHWHSDPTQVGTATNWLGLATGYDHSVALGTDFKIWAWGANSFGQLGNGSTTPSSVPVLVSSSPGPGLYWKRVLAAYGQSVAIASDGSVWQWGGGVSTPTKITFTGPFAGVKPANDAGWWTLSPVGGRFTAVLNDSSLWYWDAAASVSPQLVEYEYFDVAECNAVDETPVFDGALLIETDRSLWVATSDAGLLTPLSQATHKYLLGNALNWTRLNAGKNHFLIAKSDGSLWGWGKNTFGQLGDGSESDKIYKTQDPVRIILPTPIPDVVGKTRSDAEDKIAEMGFRVGTVSLVATDGVEVTRIISQSPAFDTLVLPGGAVNIVVSAGPPVPVPNVCGMEETSARAAISDAGLGVSTATEVWSSIIPVGAVVAQNPVAGTLVIIDSKVSLQISKGPQPKSVPYTTRRTESQARTTLESAGFVVGSVYKEYSTSVAAGYVTRSDPPYGTQAFVGDTVNLFVSLGKPKPWVGTPKAPLTMRKNSYYTVYGYLKPRHTSGTYPVRIYKWKRTSTGAWKSYGYVSAKASNYLDYTKYSKSMALTSTGKWRVRAYAQADTGHVAAWSSGYDYITVK